MLPKGFWSCGFLPSSCTLELVFSGLFVLCCREIAVHIGAFDTLHPSLSLAIPPQYQEQRYTEGSNDCVDGETPANTDAINESLQTPDSSSAQRAPDQVVARLHCRTTSRIKICQEGAANGEDRYMGTSGNKLHHQRCGQSRFSPVRSNRIPRLRSRSMRVKGTLISILHVQ